MRKGMLRKGMLTIDVLVVLLLTLTVVFVVLPWFLGVWGNARDSVDSEEMKKKWAVCSGGTPDNDWDGDGMPNHCDPCVDVPNDYVLTAPQKMQAFNSLKTAYDTKYNRQMSSSQPPEIDADRSDHDSDGLPDVCEQTLEQVWASRNMLAYLLKPPALEKLLDRFGKHPYQDYDRISCRCWYSRYQCCSMCGEDVFPLVDGERTTDPSRSFRCTYDRPKQ